MSRGALAGRAALVTGASRGIGRATAERLAAAGARVAMVARGEGELRSAASAIGGHVIPLDVADRSSVDSLPARLDDVLGGSPDILVAAAGAFTLAALADTDPEDFDRQIAVNLRAPFLLARAFVPRMVERGTGHIVLVGSIAGRLPLPGNAGYAASKFGLRGLHGVLAEELRGSGVRATLIEPAATDTSLWDPLDPDSRDDLPSRSRMMRADDVARAVLFALTQPPEVQISVVSLQATG